MIILELTVVQAGLLFEVTEMHLEWFKKKYNKPPLFEVLLELNHNKLKYAMKLIEIENNVVHSSDDISIELNRMKKSYKMLLEFF